MKLHLCRVEADMPWWVAIGVSVIAVIATALWWLLPKWEVKRRHLQIRDPKARADVEDNFRKAIGQLIGGAVVLAGAGFAYYQTLLTSQASRDQFISQQVSQGFEQLGSDKIVVRLGGVYALEGVMNTSEQYRLPVLEALCAFVRNSTAADIGLGPPATDVQASLTVIRRRAAGRDVVDLTDVHIPRSDLSNAHLHDAILPGADLRESYLFAVDLTGADLTDTNLVRASMTLAQLSAATLNGADLHNAILNGADLQNARLIGAHLVGAHLTGANLLRANLTGADLTNATVLQSQLDEACGDLQTKLPPGLTIKPCSTP
jgi:uncharacterized protein YjbI with pentapeptide repeats